MARNPRSVRWSEFTQSGMRCASQISVFFSAAARKLSCLRSASRNVRFSIKPHDSARTNTGRRKCSSKCMSTENKRTMRSLYEAFQRGGVETVLAALTPDIEWHYPGAAPYAGRYDSTEK